LLGVLSRHLDMGEVSWLESIGQNVRPELVEVNRRAFRLGRDGAGE
jgi:hypothetical protein